VIDLRSLWPWDRDAVLDSVGKTGRFWWPMKASRSAVSAPRWWRAWSRTRRSSARPKRLGAPRALIPYAPNLEDQLRVTQDMIATAARELCA
jgi:pyruvate/2-oxoglutarate/acetoin dehydrogenase E1 component